MIEVPRERVLEKKVPVYVERPVAVEREIVKEVEVPVINEIIQKKEFITERPIYIDNIIEKRVPVEKLVVKEIEVPVEHVVERPRIHENIIEKPVDYIYEVPRPVEQLVEVPREQLHEVRLGVERVREVPVPKTIKRSQYNVNTVQTPYEVRVEKGVAQPVVHQLEKKVNRFIEKPVETIIEKPMYIQRYVEKPVIIEKTIEVPVERVVDNIKTVEKLIEKPVFIESVVEREVENIVVKDVFVPVERVVEVEVEVSVQKPVYKEIVIDEEILLEATHQDFDDNYMQEEVFEHEDEEMATEIETRESELNLQIRQNNQLKSQYQQLLSQLNQFHAHSSNVEETENTSLRMKLIEIESRFRYLNEQHHNLRRKHETRKIVKDVEIRRDPRVDALRSRLKTLIGENNALADEVQRSGEQVKRRFEQKMSFNY